MANEFENEKIDVTTTSFDDVSIDPSSDGDVAESGNFCETCIDIPATVITALSGLAVGVIGTTLVAKRATIKSKLNEFKERRIAKKKAKLLEQDGVDDDSIDDEAVKEIENMKKSLSKNGSNEN